MKKLLLPLLFLLLAQVTTAQIEKVIPPKPQPPRLVVDLTGTLAQDQQQALEDKLVAYDDSTSNQISVVIIPTTGDYDIADVAYQLGRSWGVGNKEFNNGVVFLIAKNDRKVFIATGYGLEGAIPDITAKQIIEHDVVPNFRENDYYRGIDYGVDALIAAAAGEYTAPAGYNNRGGDDGNILGVLILLVIIGIILSRINRGGGGGAFMSRRGYRNWNGPTTIWFPPSGGGGGDFGGGGGGFGGFGGGSFGGGGAGGSW